MASALIGINVISLHCSESTTRVATASGSAIVPSKQESKINIISPQNMKEFSNCLSYSTSRKLKEPIQMPSYSHTHIHKVKIIYKSGGSYLRASAPPAYRCASALSSNKVKTDASRALVVQPDHVALPYHSPCRWAPLLDSPKITNVLHGMQI